MTDKKCYKCGEVKPIHEFSKDKSKKDGHQASCKECQKNYRQANQSNIAEYSREHYKANRDYRLEQQREYNQRNCDRIAEYSRQYRQQNRDRVIERNKAYKQTNRDYIAEYNREYYKANRERELEQQREWAKANRDKIRAKDAKRRALMESTSTTDPWELQQIAMFYGNCPDGWHVDHIIPLALGGKHELSNLQHLEAYINLSKSDKHPDDWDDPRPISCRT